MAVCATGLVAKCDVFGGTLFVFEKEGKEAR
jgi:hypothetical protein